MVTGATIAPAVRAGAVAEPGSLPGSLLTPDGAADSPMPGRAIGRAEVRADVVGACDEHRGLLSCVWVGAGPLDVRDRRGPGSTYTSNERPRNRQQSTKALKTAMPWPVPTGS